MDEEMEDAHAILRDAELERTREPSRSKEPAVEALFGQLLELDNVRALRVVAQADRSVLIASLDRVEVHVRYVRNDGTVQVGHYPSRDAREVQIDFDPETKRFVGREIETRRPPVPGQLPRRRAAIAVLVETIVGLVRDVAKQRG